MDNPVVFHVDIRPRCFHLDGSPQLPTCGATAGFVRLEENGVPAGYFCHRHRQAGDSPIPTSYVVNRVRIVAEITITGTSMAPTPAKTEALERVRVALEQVGAVLNLSQISSIVGRYVPPAPARRYPTNGGGGQ